MEGSRWRWSACAVLCCSMPWGSCGLTVRPSRGLRVSSWSRVLGDHYKGDDDLDWIPCLGIASGFFPFCFGVVKNTVHRRCPFVLADYCSSPYICTCIIDSLQLNC